jgi:hypothetical protein
VVIKVIQELTPQEFADTLRKGAAWLLTQDVDADRLLMDVRDDEDGCILYYGPEIGEFSDTSYQVLIEEIRRIVKEKGA